MSKNNKKASAAHLTGSVSVMKSIKHLLSRARYVSDLSEDFGKCSDVLTCHPLKLTKLETAERMVCEHDPAFTWHISHLKCLEKFDISRMAAMSFLFQFFPNIPHITCLNNIQTFVSFNPDCKAQLFPLNCECQLF